MMLYPPTVEVSSREGILTRASGSSSSSSSITRTQSVFSARSTALRARAKSSSQGKSNTVAPRSRANSAEPSLEPVSPITICSVIPAALARQFGRVAAPFLTIMAKPSVGTAISRGEKASNTQRQLFRLESDFFQSQFFATRLVQPNFRSHHRISSLSKRQSAQRLKTAARKADHDSCFRKAVCHDKQTGTPL